MDKNINLKYILCILNSKLLNFYFKKLYTDNRDTFPLMKSGNIEELPVFRSEDQDAFSSFADLMLSKNKELFEIKTQFIKVLQSKFPDMRITVKIENWYNLSFAEFSRELVKQKIKLSLEEQTEWLSHFEKHKDRAEAVKTTIEITDKTIDKMVY